MYSVYILYSNSLNTFYKGQTSNLQARIQRHNSKLEKFTKSGTPWILLWATKKETRAEAMAFESKLKNLNRQRTIQLMLRFHFDILGPDEALLIQRLSGC